MNYRTSLALMLILSSICVDTVQAKKNDTKKAASSVCPMQLLSEDAQRLEALKRKVTFLEERQADLLDVPEVTATEDLVASIEEQQDLIERKKAIMKFRKQLNELEDELNRLHAECSTAQKTKKKYRR